MRKIAGLLAIVVSLLWLIGPVGARSSVDLVGKPAPEIQAGKWYNGEGQSLARLKGKVVVVEFWATWCGPCVKAIPHLKEIHSKYSDKGVVLISLSGESAAEVDPFVKAKGMNYLVGAESETSEKYSVTGIPHAVVVGVDGKVSWQGHPMNGLDAAIEEALRKRPGR